MHKSKKKVTPKINEHKIPVPQTFENPSNIQPARITNAYTQLMLITIIGKTQSPQRLKEQQCNFTDDLHCRCGVWLRIFSVKFT
jgi:hypothetical protein